MFILLTWPRIEHHLGTNDSLDENDQITFYSSWIYAAVHALISIPEFRTPEKISQRLRVTPQQATKAIEFLISCGLLARQRNGNILSGKKQTHLGADSPLISKHHTNWRLQSIRAIEEDPQKGLHYSSVVSLSMQDFAALKEEFIETIKRAKEVIKKSPEEEICCFSLDFFPSKKNH